MIYITSFGSDRNYEYLSYDVVSSLSVSYPASLYKIYSRHNLPQWINEYAHLFKRGYGYWTWKPWILCDMLKIINDSDILIYIDGRCEVPNLGQSVKWLDKFLETPHTDITAWQLPHIEQHWSTSDLIFALGANNNNHILNSGQFSAGFFALRVGKPTKKLMEIWLRTMQNFPYLTRDEQSLIPNHLNFVEQRHDQSVFSILLKTMIAREKITSVILNNNDIYSDNLRPHAREHPTSY
jgi:hypothetical protein